MLDGVLRENHSNSGILKTRKNSVFVIFHYRKMQNN